MNHNEIFINMVQDNRPVTAYEAIQKFGEQAVCFIGIETAEIGFGFELSEPLNSRFEQICNDVSNTILKIKENTASDKWL